MSSGPCETGSPLAGSAWDHSRAFPPIVAAAQRFEESVPGARIRWEKRTLHEFGHMPLDELAARYDLIVIDHPWAGFCFENDLVEDLAAHFGAEERREWRENSVGLSYESYEWEGKLLAVPIDAATPTPSWRPDLLARHGLDAPKTWEDAVALADRGLAAMPGFPVDLFLNWLMLLHALDGAPFESAEALAEVSAAKEAMGMLKRLAEGMPDDIYEWNPIRVGKEMTKGDRIVYCPFAYSYSNYCRPSYTRRPLKYGDLVEIRPGRRLRSIVGGTGLAISRRCRNLSQALEFVRFASTATLQAGLYGLSGGQPARTEAWEDAGLNAVCGDFFRDSRRAHEEAVVRPRYSGYVPLQETAGRPLQQYLKGTLSQEAAWEEINRAYRQSLKRSCGETGGS